MGKQFVEVYAYFDKLGHVTPACLWWTDGKRYEIDKVLEVCRAASILGGGLGTRYTCRILGKERYLYYDNYEQKWFVEIADKRPYPFWVKK